MYSCYTEQLETWLRMHNSGYQKGQHFIKGTVTNSMFLFKTLKKIEVKYGHVYRADMTLSLKEKKNQ